MSRREKGARAPEPPVAQIAHACAGRTRLRLAALKGDSAAFTAVCDKALTLSGVHRVEGRPATGSLILSHEGPADRLLEAAGAAGVFRVARPEPETGTAAQMESLQDLAEAALKAVGGPTGVARGGAIVALLAMAALQASRGNVMPPATTAIWYAMSLLIGHGLASGDLGEDA